MKKIILSIAMLASVAFVSCSDDDDNKDSCKTCTLTLVSINTSTKYCDNGDGKITATIAGQETSIDIPEGMTFDTYISNAIEKTGATCK